MNVTVKIPRKLFEKAIADLRRPHPFAYERAGFFSTKRSTSKGRTLVHCVDYHPVSDAHYIRDESVGVRIGPGAITEAMSRTLNESVGQIHVHFHGGHGLPFPSMTDSDELPPLLRSLRNASAKEAHGWMILGVDDAWTSILLWGQFTTIEEAPISIVGFPLVLNRRNAPAIPAKPSWFSRLARRKQEHDRYNRQSFLGENADSIIQNALIGIVGLGGGGSHMVQQLAHLGFRKFVFCDHDRISESNLNRLVGASAADVRAKRFKTVIAERNVRKLHKGASIASHISMWEDATDDLIGCDLIVGSVDTFSARRDLEAFCRRHLIPYVDVGMDVHKLESGRFEIYGQVILSNPGNSCMHCMGFLSESVLAHEAQAYGAAGNKPQVVWSNGLLCSAAVGVIVDLLTDWSSTCRGPVHLNFRGSSTTLTTDNRLPTLKGRVCPHFPLHGVGDVILKPL